MILAGCSCVGECAGGGEPQQGRKTSLRIKAVKALASWLPTRPSLRATLAEASQKDPAEAVRKAAAKALGQ